MAAEMDSRQQVQTVEQTGKKWKAMVLVGWLSLLGSCAPFAMVGASGGPSTFASTTFALMLLGGIGLIVVGRIGGWWNHG